MKTLILISIICLSYFNPSLSQEYRYLVADKREKVSIEKLIAGLTNNFYELSTFDCGTNNHKQLFTNFSSLNPSNNSLIIKEGSREYVFRDGEILKRNGKRKRSLSPFMLAAKNALKEISKYQVGETLIKKIQSSPFKVYLTYGLPMFIANYKETPQLKKENNYSMALMALETQTYPIERLPLDQIGTGGVIRWNPKTKVERRESDDILRATSPAIALAHEMYHAYDSIRGYLSSIFVLQNQGYEMQPIQEYRAVYFENMLRKEMGLKYAKKYSPDSKGSMLDSNNEPYLLPASCLNL